MDERKGKAMPQVREFTQTTYTFAELDDKARERALSIMREFEDQSFHWVQDDVWHDFREHHLEPFGIENAEYQYSGFWSQGDGASFTGRVDLATWIRKTGNYHRFRRVYIAVTEGYENVGVTAYIERTSHHYAHEYTVRAVIEVEDWAFGHASEHIMEQVTACEEALNEWVRDQSRALYKALYDEYEYRVSDAALEDMIEANDYEFDREGNFPPRVFDAVA